MREHGRHVVKELDFKTIISHWEKIQQDIVTIDVIHDAIMNKLTEEEGETEEADYAIHSAKMIGTSNSLAELARQLASMVAARLSGSRLVGILRFPSWTDAMCNLH